MNKAIEIIKQEWERTLLAGLTAVLVIIGAVLAFEYLNSEEEPPENTKAKTTLPYYYDTKLLTPQTVAGLPKTTNPLLFLLKKPLPPKQQQTATTQKPQTPPKNATAANTPKPKPTPPPAQPAQPKPQPTKPAVKVPQPKPAQPKPRVYRNFDMRYIGSMSIEGGQSEAHLYISETLQNKQTKAATITIAVGQKIQDNLFTVKSFDADNVTLIYGDNKQIVLPLGGKGKHFTIDVTP